MIDLILSIKANKLKVLSYSKNEYKTINVDVPSEIVNDTKIVDEDGFSNFLLGVLSSNYPNYKKCGLNFVVEPSEVVLKYVTLGKNGPEQDALDPLLQAIKETVGSEYDLDDLYFQTQKLAPFFYQFVGVRKDFVEKYIKLADSLEVSLNSLVPWVLLLPDFTRDSNPSLYISDTENSYSVTVSELLGVYFSEEYSKDMSQNEIIKTVDSLATFKRTKPINKIYTLNDINLQFGDEYTVLNLKFEGAGFENYAGFEILSLVLTFLLDKPTFLGGSQNLLTYLPLPVLVKSTKPMIISGGVMLSLLALVGGWYFFKTDAGANPSASELAAQQSTQSNVLAETTQSSSSATEATDTKTSVDLKKSDLKIRVENGAGVAGIAGKEQTRLEELGYQVLSVGNAAENRKGTLVNFKKSAEKYKDLLSKDMGTAKITVETTLGDTEAYDVLVVLGSE